MSENNITNKIKTPLRNANSANKPFRSPLTTVLTPINNESPKNVLRQSPQAKSATPKRSISQFRLPIKRRRIENIPNDNGNENETQEIVSQCDLLELKKRICSKRLELDRLQTKLNYIKKHNTDDLMSQINKWRSACKEALFQFHKDIRDKTSEPLNMRQVLLSLGISEEIIKFQPEECDLT